MIKVSSIYKDLDIKFQVTYMLILIWCPLQDIYKQKMPLLLKRYHIWGLASLMRLK